MSTHRRSRVAVRGPVSIIVGVAAGVIALPVVGLLTALLAGWAALAIVNVAWRSAFRTRSSAT